MIRPRSATAAALIALLFAAGCNFVGPRAVRRARYHYNEALRRTGNEQLLLNLVRLKYRDTPFFLEVTSVSTQYTFSTNAGASVGKTDGAPASVGASAGLAYTERPTVTYAPLQGEKFVKQLLSPVSTDTLLLLYHSGWSIERILRCCVQQLGKAKNAPSASGPTPDYVPPYAEFVRAAKILRGFQVRDQLYVVGRKHNEATLLAIVVVGEAIGSEEHKELNRLLGKPEDVTELRLYAGLAGDGHISNVRVITRSLMGVMFYLSQAVAAPERDVRNGYVTVTKNKDGEPFDWDAVIGDILHVKSFRYRPAHAAVATPYRGSWFYIDDADLKSKSTFSLLAQLFSLQSGDVRGAIPMLTLPLGP